MTASETSKSVASKGRILVIDDEFEIRESLSDLLSLEGYAVELAQNAAEGERKLLQKPYDLVLLDLMMPDKSGMEVLRDLRETDSETPVFMVTAYGSVDVAVQAIKLGATHFVTKPWDNAKLLREIERITSGPLLQSENQQLKRIVADQVLEVQALKEIARGNF